MLKPASIKFLNDLRKNNNREWFEKNRERYETARADFNDFIENLLAAMSKEDASLSSLEAKDCVFRIYRDVRFSKDKTPYKAHFSASIKSGGKKSGNCGFYLQVGYGENWGTFVAGGFWMPEASVLKQLRQEVEYNSEEFKSIINNKTFKKWFGELENHKLKKAPKGVDPDHPDVELLKYTSFIATHELEMKDAGDKNFLKTCVGAYKAMKPMINFLNRALH